MVGARPSSGDFSMDRADHGFLRMTGTMPTIVDILAPARKV